MINNRFDISKRPKVVDHQGRVGGRQTNTIMSKQTGLRAYFTTPKIHRKAD